MKFVEPSVPDTGTPRRPSDRSPVLRGAEAQLQAERRLAHHGDRQIDLVMQESSSVARGDRGHRLGFVMEQTLGHVTHYTNMRSAIDADGAVEATWYPLHFEPAGRTENLPVLRSNWSARASWQAWRKLGRDRATERFDALFFHTQVTTLLSAGVMRRVPSIISLDATPLNYDVVGAAYGHQQSSSALESVKQRLNMRALGAAGALVTWCDWARQSLIDDYGVDPGRVTVIAP